MKCRKPWKVLPLAVETDHAFPERCRSAPGLFCPASAGVGETGGYATRTLAAVGNTVDVARQLAAQPSDDGNARIVLSEAVAIAARFDARGANGRGVVLPGDAFLKVTSIDGATALFKAQAATVE